MHQTVIRRLAVLVLVLAAGVATTGCGTVRDDPNLKAGPSVAIPSDGRLGGSWWMHPNGAKLKP